MSYITLMGVFLALEGKPLFPERIEAWTYGPVVPDVYRQFKQYEGRAIPSTEAVTASPIQDKEIQGILEEVYQVFGQFSPWRLRDMTHQEDPYKEASAKGEISTESMKHYFRQRYIENNGETSQTA